MHAPLGSEMKIREDSKTSNRRIVAALTVVSVRTVHVYVSLVARFTHILKPKKI
jgi:hypothetical protein